jgi:peptidoglycan L-alanyl-D-glutamate endopeptidase CwlK
MTDDARHTHNNKMLQRINPRLRPKIAAVISDLEGHGDQPLIDSGVYRSPAEQMQKFRAGFSKVRWSFHNATSKTGAPDSLAVDITDARYGWDSPQSFWLRLAASAQAHGLECGIYWGLKAHQRAAITNAIAAQNWTPGNISLGWDTAHLQVKGISLRQAKWGKRP